MKRMMCRASLRRRREAWSSGNQNRVLCAIEKKGFKSKDGLEHFLETLQVENVVISAGFPFAIHKGNSWFWTTFSSYTGSRTFSRPSFDLNHFFSMASSTLF